MMLAACGGSGSNDSNRNNANPGGSTVPGGSTTPGGGATPPAGGANSVALVKQAMTGAHEATSAELPGYLASGPSVTAAVAPATARALGGFGQVFTATTNSAANTRVHLRNFETFVRSGGKWHRVQFSGKLKGATYASAYAGAAQPCSLDNGCLRAEDDGGVSFKPVAGRFLRFWPEAAFTQSLVDPAKVEAVFSTVQSRLVRDSGAADDRASAKYLVNVGAAWAAEGWAQVDFFKGGYPDVASLDNVGNGRLTLVTRNFAASSFHSATADTQVDELAVAVAGSRAPLANSQDVRDDDDVVRIQLIGDSITQGSDAAAGERQDSFRRALWNGIVADPAFPMVDFVGTRKGTSVVDVNACGEKITVADTGSYKLPEFDTDHQGYWGACVEQVNAILPAELKTLDSDAQRSEPDVAIIHIGTNNLHNDKGVDSVIRELSAQIALLRATNDDVAILVAQVVPFLLTEKGAVDPRVAELNAAIAARIAPLGTAKSPVVVVNQNEGFGPELLRDRFHPTDAGEQKIADKWLAALKAANLLVDRD